jgi:hypothetical protein
LIGEGGVGRCLLLHRWLPPYLYIVKIRYRDNCQPSSEIFTV